MDRIIRPSEIKQFKRCRRQWNLRYNEGLVTDTSGTASLGTLVHAALEAHYLGNDPYTVLALLGESEDVELASIMVEGYLQWLEDTGIDAGLEVEGVERTITVPLPTPILGDVVTLQGHIDLLATDHLGVRKLIDHKTVQSLDQYTRQLQVDDQMLTYAVMLKMQGIEIGGAIHNALKRVKRTARATPPFFQRNEVHYNDNQLRSHYLHIVGVIRDMVHVHQWLENESLSAQEVLYPSPTKDCTWDCPFMAICPMHDDGSDIDGVIQMMKERLNAEAAAVGSR